MPEKKFKVIEAPRTVVTYRLTQDEISHLGSHGSTYNWLSTCGFTFLGTFLGLLSSLASAPFTKTMAVMLIMTAVVTALFFVLAFFVIGKNNKKMDKQFQKSIETEPED